MKYQLIIEKLKRIPRFIWFLILGASIAFKEMYITGELIKSLPELIESMGEQFAIVSSQMELMSNMMYFTNALVGIFLFELIVYLAYNSLLRRKMLADKLTLREFAFPVRILFIISNIASGIVGISYFWLPNVAFYGTDLVPFVFNAIAFVLAFFILKELKYIEIGKLKDTFNLFAKTYSGIYIVLAVLNFINYRHLGSEYMIVYTAIIVLALIFLLYSNMIQPKLQEMDKKDLEKINNDNDDSNSSPPPKEIFKGFGF